METPNPHKTPLVAPPTGTNNTTPNLTINTSAQPTTPTPTPPATAAATTPQSASPPRPPISPITPTLGPADKPGSEGGLGAFPPRQTYAHAQPNQVGVPAPQPRPILFDENPDALALRSAIAVLQMQKRRAEGDIVSLHRAKEAALSDAEGFTRDLGAGRIRTGPSAGGGGGGDDDDDGEDMDGEEEGRGKEAKPWSELPSRQDVVRCPPINWSRYAVVGESLDKMHDEQREAPTLGVPATLGAGGAFEFKGDGDRRGFTGIAAPYTPGRDKLADKKPKASRR
ncbi:uncharacterized protein DNG_03607 [Cephalotrichum gorgonifer]|uniref:Uncharacterized protein n=1 Tax=Cephalotrichum gorgonifer TaxID=2041049 RepID=A0AAE8MUJ2_9PEZI|nr:uncharacterized protein DNG_03607 [Cephalotrichum gorgonifer]